MTLYTNPILKRDRVNLDTENPVVIDVIAPVIFDEAGALGSQESQDSNEQPDFAKKEAEATNAAARIIKHAESQAEDILSNAMKAAAEKQAAIQKAAEDDAAKLLEETRESAYKDAMDKATSEGEAIKQDAQKVLDDAQAEHKKMQDSLEPDIVNMIISIAEKLLGNIAEINPKVVLNLIKQGFAAATISGEVIVYVSKDDYDLVTESKDDLLAFTDGSVKLIIKKDLSLSPMDCVIETPFGDIDCSLGQQFESLRANLTYILNNK